MRIMKIFKTEEKYNELRLDKDAEFVKLDGRSYVIQTGSRPCLINCTNS
jgi:hypothetical protein